MLLKVKGLSVSFPGVYRTATIVDQVDIQLHRAETLCIVGESGSGKSMTALSVMRLLPPNASYSANGIWLQNKSDDDYRDLLQLTDEEMPTVRGQRIAMIFQEPMSSLNPVFTVGEQIVEALQLCQPHIGFTQAKQMAIHSLVQVKIDAPEQRFDDYPHRLSGGQRQRIMIAMALVCQPDLLIADEPTTALDVTVQAEMLTLIKQLQISTGMGVLFITHDLGVVAQIADRVAVMNNGKIVETGTTAQVLRQPEHVYTRKLMAALPENLARPEPVADQMASTVALSVRDLHVHFARRSGLFRRISGYLRAVDGVSLDIMHGEIVALVGESGSGKSTFGRALVRLLKLNGGTVDFNGHRISELGKREFKPYRRRLQFVFQDPVASLNPRHDIASMLCEPMAVNAIGESAEDRLERAASLLSEVNLPRDTLWRYPHEFSGGQRQRIGIARALVVQPEFLVCDEITSALDVSVQADILQMLLHLRARYKLTLLFITHNISVVEYLSDRTVVMYNGKFVESGDTAQICNAPLHEYTQRLLAAVPRLNGRSYVTTQ